MKNLLRIKWLFLPILLGLLAGCATPNVPLNQHFWHEPQQKVYVALAKEPKPELTKEGPQGVVDILINDAVTSNLRQHLEQYRLDNFNKIQQSFVKDLRQRGISAIAYKPHINLKNYKQSGLARDSYSVLDFTPLAKELGDHKLLLFSIISVGAKRRYYGFIPLDAPKGSIYVEGRLINLRNNKMLWRYHVDIKESLHGQAWDQPPNYPNLTHALDKAISAAKHDLTQNFFGR